MTAAKAPASLVSRNGQDRDQRQQPWWLAAASRSQICNAKKRQDEIDAGDERGTVEAPRREAAYIDHLGHGLLRDCRLRTGRQRVRHQAFNVGQERWPSDHGELAFFSRLGYPLWVAKIAV